MQLSLTSELSSDEYSKVLADSVESDSVSSGLTSPDSLCSVFSFEACK